MKEVTRIITMNVTMIEKVKDESADRMVAAGKTQEGRRVVANNLKDFLGADDVQITGIKDFVRDIHE